MFFSLSKILNLFFDIYNLIFVFLLISIILLIFKNKKYIFFISISALLIIISSLAPTGILLLNYLERDYYESKIPDKIDGIIVLSGAIEPELTREFKKIQLNESAERLTEFILLSREKPRVKKIFSGGSAILFDKSLNQSKFASKLFNEFDIQNIIYENKSRNTYENILFSHKIINPEKHEKWVLITSAYHMKRALLIGNELNWNLIPFAVDFKTNKNIILYKNFKLSKNLYYFNTAIRELLGIIMYQIYYLD
jgi:uncharacterized SAM-binding protein YcdF (DUF218 family)